MQRKWPRKTRTTRSLRVNEPVKSLTMRRGLLSKWSTKSDTKVAFCLQSVTKQLERHSDSTSSNVIKQSVPKKSKQGKLASVKSNASAKVHSKKTSSCKFAKNESKKSSSLPQQSSIKKLNDKLTVTEFRKLFGYSNETHDTSHLEIQGSGFVCWVQVECPHLWWWSSWS
jgi:hypothetical protein